MKFLICGLGSIGRRHLRNLRMLGEHDIVLYRTHRSTLPDDDLAGIPVETDIHAALEHGPHAAVISNPTALHLEAAIPAARAGCHLMLEKPISHSLEGIDELKEALEQGGGQVLVGYQFRFHPTLRRAAALIAEGTIGKPLSARSHWGEYLPGWHPWEDYRQSYSARPDLGGGVVLTLSHTLDYLPWLLGEVDAVWAFAGKLSSLELQVEDTAEIGLRFGSGGLGSVHLNYHQRPPAHTLEITGEQGTLRWDNASGSLRVYSALADAWEEYPPAEGFERNQMFVDLMRHFIAVAERKEQPICSLEDGLRALRLSLAALRSAETGQRVEMERFGG
jgi:predicted dehydrogenase